MAKTITIQYEIHDNNTDRVEIEKHATFYNHKWSDIEILCEELKIEYSKENYGKGEIEEYAQDNNCKTFEEAINKIMGNIKLLIIL